MMYGPPPPPLPPAPPPPAPGREAANVAMMVFGVLALIVGGLAWYITGSAAHECSSGLIYALDQSQCGSSTAVHTIGGWGALIGLALAITGAVRR